MNAQPAIAPGTFARLQSVCAYCGNGNAMKEFAMKTQNIVVALVAIAGGISLSVVTERPVIAEKPVAMADIDFSALHRQANEALDRLRQQVPANSVVF
jgi:hypothetical protein